MNRRAAAFMTQRKGNAYASRSRHKGPKNKDISYLTDLGAGTRRHYIVRDLKTFFPYVALAIALQALAYGCHSARRCPSAWASNGGPASGG